MMDERSLSEQQRLDAVALFAAGHGPKSVANRVGGRLSAVKALRDRWRVRGQEVLVPAATRRVFSFEIKCAVVQRFLTGESRVALAQEYALTSPDLVKKWARIYRIEGEDGLRPKPTGRPQREPDAPEREESELEGLRRENERLRAEVAYLGKLRALIAAERR